jgi:hypothetical protein
MHTLRAGAECSFQRHPPHPEHEEVIGSRALGGHELTGPVSHVLATATHELHVGFR